MKWEYVEPVTTRDRDGNLRTTHPAFGQINVNRTTGKIALYGSDFVHNDYITITISTAETRRRLSGDSRFPEDQIIKVALSEAQWAMFVSSIGVGAGAPATIQRLNNEAVPALPPPPSPTTQFGADFQEGLENALKEARAVKERIDAMGLPKGKAAEIKAGMDALIRFISSSAPFIQDQFREHMEGAVEQAKAEVHGHMTGMLARAGLGALGGRPPLEIEAPKDQRPPYIEPEAGEGS